MATTLTTTSSATTSGVLPSLLDLLAPAATPAGGKSGAAFDALLQPPPARPAATDDQRRWQDSAESRSQRAESPRPLPPDTREQELEPPHDEAANLDPVANDAVIAVEDDATNETEPKDDEQVVAESLAGLTMCVLPVPTTEKIVSGEEAAVETIERGASKRANKKLDASSKQPGEADAVVADAEGGEIRTTELAERNAERAAANETHAAIAPSGTKGSSTVDADQAAATADATGEAAVAGVTLIQPVEPPTEATPDQRDGKSSGAEIELAAATADRPAETSSIESAAINAIETPVVAAAATPQVTTDTKNVGSSSGSSNTSGVQAAGSGRPPRLPAELLTQDAGRAARSTATPVDTTRLLTRVARAFAAAQQRDGEIQLRLSPPELGSLKLTLQMQDGGLVARLETETSSAKTAIIENLPALRERLAEQGVRIERFDVDLMQRQPGGMPDRPSDQQREAPLPRSEPAVRPRGEAALPVRGMAAAGGSTSGLNVIV